MHKGYLIFELTCHLPFVKHLEQGKFPEENWLNDAISGTYLPLLNMLNRLESDAVPFKLIFTISPTLASMLSDEYLQDRYIEYLDGRIGLGEKEVVRTSFSPKLKKLAEMYLAGFRQNRYDFIEVYKKNILSGFTELEKKGKIKIITTFASHCYAPFFAAYPKIIEAQIYTAMTSHNRIFNNDTKGFWLPEMGYYPGIEKLLKKYKVEYFFTAIHSFLFGSKLPRNGIYAPVNVSDSGVCAFARDLASSKYILSYDNGYPGDFSFREYYRDIGFEMSDEYLCGLIYENGIRVGTGYKYYANTGKPKEGKKIYVPEEAALIVEKQAENFIYNLKKRIRKLLKYADRPSVLVCPYDAQVFGHWWFEGIPWLESVIRKLAADDELSLIFPEEYLYTYKIRESVDLSYSSCGNDGYSGVWLNGDNDWIYRHIHVIIEKMNELVERFPDEKGLKRRALNHAGREVLLSEASDWPFIMNTGIAVPYAKRRIKEHVNNFLKIYNDLSSNSVDTEWLTTIEKKNSLFSDLDYRIFK